MTDIVQAMADMAKKLDQVQAREPDDILIFLYPSEYQRYKEKGWLTPYHRMIQPEFDTYFYDPSILMRF